MLREIECANWGDFKKALFEELFECKPPTRRRYLFRGQRDAEWGLTSAFDRVFHYANDDKRKSLYANLLRYFAEAIEIDPDLAGIRNDDWRLAALAQHSGVPTKLLDWSESPYVAAFFAFQDAIRHLTSEEGTGALVNRPVAVYALDREHSIWNAEKGVEIKPIPGERNIRMIRQGGHFTVSRTPFATLEEWIEQCGVDGALLRFLVSFQEAPVALADLDLMGINHAGLFGDEPDAWARAALSKAVLEWL